MRLNNRQRVVLWIGALVMALMAVVPPWRVEGRFIKPRSGTLEWAGGYRFIWSSGTVSTGTYHGSIYAERVDVTRLVIQWAAVAFLVATGVVVQSGTATAPINTRRLLRNVEVFLLIVLLASLVLTAIYAGEDFVSYYKSLLFGDTEPPALKLAGLTEPRGPIERMIDLPEHN